jgi:broad specificity phosphatase PhoE
MPGATTFHLIRHAEYALTGQVLGGRAPGHALTDRGRAQAERLADALAERPLAAVVSSPLERAQETALPIAAALNLELGIDPGFHEIDFGDWTGLPFELLDDQPAWRAWNRFRSMVVPPNGEGMAAAQVRALAALGALRAAHPDGEVAVVSHGDIVKAVLAHALGTPLDMMRRIEISPGSRSVLVLYDEDARVDAVNLPPGNLPPGA